MSGVRRGRRVASFKGIKPPALSSLVDGVPSAGHNSPQMQDQPCPPPFFYAASFVGDAMVSAALRTANETITRVTPLKMRLTPTKVPIAQAELDGHCM
jgi:hypothetical protein